MKTLPSLFVLALVACSSVEPTGNTANIPDGASDGQAVLSDASVDAETAPDSSSVDAGPVDKAARCASTFGSGLTKPFGRLDGIVRAVVPPAHPTCPQPNGTHLILQLDAGQPLETYRVVVNVASDRAGDARVRFRAFEHPSLAPWVDGWHGNTPLDYVRDLGLQSEATGFAPMEQAALVQTVTDAIPLGASVSAYSSTSGGASSHLIHRVDTASNQDGALVIHRPGREPLWLVFHFATQTF
jgi:hypothetical protein